MATSVGIMESATETTSVFAQALTVEDTAGLNNVRTILYCYKYEHL